MSMESQSKNMDTKSENGLPLSVGRATGQDLQTALSGSAHLRGPWTVRSEPIDDEPKGKYVQHYIEPHIAEVFYVTEEGAGIARLIAAAPALRAALQDMLNGWRYIRQSHGDLYGVGWDRCEQSASAALAACEAVSGAVPSDKAVSSSAVLNPNP